MSTIPQFFFKANIHDNTRLLFWYNVALAAVVVISIGHHNTTHDAVATSGAQDFAKFIVDLTSVHQSPTRSLILVTCVCVCVCVCV